MKALMLAGLLACIAAPAMAQDAAPSDEAAAMAAAQEMVDGLGYRTGDIAIPAAKATLHVKEGFRFLDTADTRRVLEDLWGNPPDDSVLGMLVPTSAGLLDDHAWAVVITYSDDGHVTDEDAAEIDYDEMLATMQEETRDANEARAAAGYGTVDLVGWASAPRYDAAAKKLYWAKRLKFDGAEADTLNYDVRVLGREGYLSMNAVADIDDLATVEAGMQNVLAMAEFDEGARYADFNESTDKVAGYGIAALVAGAAASKMGLFAKLGALLIAGKKLIIPLLIGIGALVSRVFRKKAAPETP
jgi:uncharacterized membrane-anchored protein